MAGKNKKQLTQTEYDPPEVMEEELVQKSALAIRFTRYLLLMGAVLLVAILLIVNRNHLTVDNFRRLAAKIDIGMSWKGVEDGTEIELGLTEDSSVRAYKDGMACLTPSKLTIMDNAGTVFLDTKAGFSSPDLVTNDRYTLCYDRGGTRLMMTNSFAVVAEKEFEEPIFLARMNEDGALAVITLSKGYRSTVHVFDTSFKEIFTWSSVDRYIVDADIAPSGDSIVMSCYNVKDAQNTAEIVCFTFDSEKMAWNVPLENDVSIAVRYKNNNTICVVRQNELLFLNKKGKQTAKFSFENRFLQSYNLEQDDYTAVALSPSQYGYSTLCIINNRGKQSATIDMQAHVMQLETKGKQVAMLTDRGASIFAADTKKMIWETYLVGAKSICFSAKNCLLVVNETKAVYNVVK